MPRRIAISDALKFTRGEVDFANFPLRRAGKGQSHEIQHMDVDDRCVSNCRADHKYQFHGTSTGQTRQPAEVLHRSPAGDPRRSAEQCRRVFANREQPGRHGRECRYRRPNPNYTNYNFLIGQNLYIQHTVSLSTSFAQDLGASPGGQNQSVPSSINPVTRWWAFPSMAELTRSSAYRKRSLSCGRTGRFQPGNAGRL